MEPERDNGAVNDEEVAKKTLKERTPLPKFQLFIVFLIQFSEPVTATVIYPFINEFVRSTGIIQGDEAKTGYYAGIIESTFFISETMTVFLWGWCSDIFGRKPILLLGPLGLSLSMLGFGWSSSFWSLVYYRCLQGFFNGNIGVSKSILAEVGLNFQSMIAITDLYSKITDKSNIGDAIALSPLMWNSGVTLGPMLGGLLTRPAERWPDSLGKIALLREYPYFLPCAAAAALAFLSFAISAVGLKETLASVKHTKLITRASRIFANNNDSTKPLLSIDPQAEYGSTENGIFSVEAPKSRPKISELFVRDMVSVYLNYATLAFLDMAHAALLPLVYSTPIEYGGLGMQPYQIGTLMSIYGLTSGILQTILLGWAMRRFGPKALYSKCLGALVLSLSAFPIANAFARDAGYVDWRVACTVFLQYCSLCFISPCYASIFILVTQTVPRPELMGSANGVAQMVTSGMRSLAPTFASSLFAISIAYNFAGGYMVYLVLAGMVMCGMFLARILPAPSP